MANITAALVKELRERTGAGMMDCKKALEESDGDFDKAVEFLRIKGAKDIGKRAERTTALATLGLATKTSLASRGSSTISERPIERSSRREIACSLAPTLSTGAAPLFCASAAWAAISAPSGSKARACPSRAVMPAPAGAVASTSATPAASPATGMPAITSEAAT